MPQVWQRLRRIETLAEQISAAQNSKQGSNRVANGNADGPINGVSGLPANAAAHHHPRPQTASDRSTPSQVSASELHEKHIRVVIMIVSVVFTLVNLLQQVACAQCTLTCVMFLGKSVQ